MTASRFFPVNRWNRTGTIVGVTFTFDSAEAAEKAGREQAARWNDQKFDRVFEGTWEGFNALRAASSAVPPARPRRK